MVPVILKGFKDPRVILFETMNILKILCMVRSNILRDPSEDPQRILQKILRGSFRRSFRRSSEDPSEDPQRILPKILRGSFRRSQQIPSDRDPRSLPSNRF
jgi:hypothetical protein